MKTLDSLSDKIYVINLKKRKDRLQHILSELSRINCVNFEIIEAVDGTTIENPTKMKRGNYGLNLTYLKIYEKCKNTKSNIMIIEDDCVFCENFLTHMNEYIENVPSDWDMIYFGANHNYHLGYNTSKINDYCKKITDSICAHCVILKINVFEELIDHIKMNELENDIILYNLQKKYNAYSPTNPLTKQLENYSDIEGSITNYDHLIN